ncbi:peptidoglycan-binding protein, partial [Patescibacteria group bacterium]|nr:peptidoglycan-binding protein [Patescibacteria group bacterium]
VVTLAPVAAPAVTAPAPTVTTPAPAGQVLGAAVFRFTRTLDLGAQGNDVTELQNMLISEGVYSGPVTGYYGPLTEGAVKKLQAKYGISQVGAVGPLTLAKLNEDRKST